MSEMIEEHGNLREDVKVAMELVTEIGFCMNPPMKVTMQELNGDYLSVSLESEAGDSVWGTLGMSLDALQTLINAILFKRVRTELRLLLDADNYRVQRAESLRSLALNIAREVKERNEEAELEPLPPHERRIIHTVLAEDPDIRTYSEGLEPARHVVIAPK